MSAPALTASGLTHRFGELVAVDGVTLDVPTGAVFGLLGPDGAGKSTLLRMLATVLLPDAGDAAVFGASIIRDPGAVTPRIGYMSQQFCLYPDLSVAENIEFFATVRGVPRARRRARAAELLAAMGMAEFTRRPAGRLSGGMKQKLMLTTTLMHSPDLLLLDEPTTGVDPVSRREFWAILADLNAAGTTVLVATPYMDEAERCSHIAFMADGRITQSGTPAEVKALIPGTVLEVAGPDPRAALALLADAPGVASAHLLGEVVRVLVQSASLRSAGFDKLSHRSPSEPSHRSPSEPSHRSPSLSRGAERSEADAAASRLTDHLRDHGVAADVRVIDPDMEAAFAYLVEAS